MDADGSQTTLRSYAMIACAALLWGLWSLFFRPAEQMATLAPAFEALVVFLTMFVALLPWALRARRREPRPAGAWWAIVYLGIGDAMNVLLFFMAMQRTTLSVAVLTHYLAPVLIAALAPIVLQETLGPRIWLALGLAFGGLALLLEPWRAPSEGALEGAALGTGSAVFYAANVLVTKRVQKWFKPHELLVWHIPSALLVLAFFVPARAFEVGLAPLSLVACAGLVIGALAGVLYLTGLSRVPASRASLLTLLEPVVAVLVGVAVWGERLRAPALLGGLLVLGAAASVMVNAREPNRR